MSTRGTMTPGPRYEMKALRQHADDPHRQVVDLDRASDHFRVALELPLPQVVADGDRVDEALADVVAGHRAPEDRRHPERGQEVVAGRDGGDRLHVIGRRETAGRLVEHPYRLEQIIAVAQRVELLAIERRLMHVAGHVGAEQHHAVRLAKRQRRQQYAFHDREHRRRRADAERHYRDRGSGERRAAAKHAQSECEVAKHQHEPAT